MNKDFTLGELVELLDQYNVLTIEDLRDVMGNEQKVTWDEFKNLLEEHQKKQRKITIDDLRQMTDDAHVMIPDPGTDPPR